MEFVSILSAWEKASEAPIWYATTLPHTRLYVIPEVGNIAEVMPFAVLAAELPHVRTGEARVVQLRGHVSLGLDMFRKATRVHIPVPPHSS
jgi:hypothetical protein